MGAILHLDLALRLPDALAEVMGTANADGLNNAVLQRLAAALNARAINCQKILMANSTTEAG